MEPQTLTQIIVDAVLGIAAFASAVAGVLNPNTDQAGGFNEGTA